MIQCYVYITQEHKTILENIVYNTPKIIVMLFITFLKIDEMAPLQLLHFL